MARLVVVSFRLGGTDGVSIEAQKWISALESLGHDVVRVAGEGPVDVVVRGLALETTEPPSLDELRRAFSGADLVVVENLASLPLNPGARDVLYQALDGRKAIFHHHDLAWQREHLAHLEGPRDQANWHHVTINELSRRELAERGVHATTLMNSFDCDPPLGRRAATRGDLRIDTQRLMLLATRAIPRKNVEGALALARSLDAVLWLLGPSEDGYAQRLQQLIDRSGVDVRTRLDPQWTIHDAYAAADLVVMPSTWEGFGNPVLESVTHRRPLAINPYPVAREIMGYGFEFFGLDDAAAISKFLDEPDSAQLERNLDIARAHFNVDTLPTRLGELLETAGLQRHR